MIDLFVWNEDFLTHIDSVDGQHKELVDLINDLVELSLSAEERKAEDFKSVQEGLVHYVSRHFTTEEALMREKGLDARHYAQHRQAHRSFTQGIDDLGKVHQSPSKEQLRNLSNYLVQWLAYHILEIDKSMARQIAAIEQGQSPAKAFDRETIRLKSNTEPLLKAMNGLFYLVSERNHELRVLNEELEERVRLRTEELEQANRQLKILATQDELTMLPNRRFALLSLQQMLLEKERYKNPFSVMLIDADEFKQVNDRFGHDQGDVVIKSLAERLRRSIRTSDIVCRLGGDEFLVICPHCDKDGALGIGAKILESSQPVMKDELVIWKGSLSIGVAEAEKDMTTADDVIKAADLAMYAVKKKGGGAVGA